jgi:hypothetical protein
VRSGLWRGFQMVKNSENSRPFTNRMFVRCPSVLPMAVERAAAQRLMTSSEYVRRSVIERLAADGIDLAQIAGAA